MPENFVYYRIYKLFFLTADNSESVNASFSHFWAGGDVVQTVTSDKDNLPVSSTTAVPLDSTRSISEVFSRELISRENRFREYSINTAPITYFSTVTTKSVTVFRKAFPFSYFFTAFRDAVFLTNEISTKNNR